MFISDFAIRKPIITVVTMLALVVFGLAALLLLKTDEFPDVQPILAHAWRCGIRAFDTALGYGDALYLLADGGIPAERIICKCRRPLTPNVINGAWAMRWLIHNPALDEIAHTMVGCGVSVYRPEEVERAQRLNVAPIQAPARA